MRSFNVISDLQKRIVQTYIVATGLGVGQDKQLQCSIYRYSNAIEHVRKYVFQVLDTSHRPQLRAGTAAQQTSYERVQGHVFHLFAKLVRRERLRPSKCFKSNVFDLRSITTLRLLLDVLLSAIGTHLQQAVTPDEKHG